MRGSFARGALALAAATVAALGLAACGGDTGSGPSATSAVVDSSTAPTTTMPPSSPATAPPSTTTTAPGPVISITVTGGSVDGPGRQRVTLGEEVTLRVTSDRADEVHVHTYDLHADVGPGGPSEITFRATIPGVFEIELEGSGRKILDLEVSP